MKRTMHFAQSTQVRHKDVTYTVVSISGIPGLLVYNDQGHTEGPDLSCEIIDEHWDRITAFFDLPTWRVAELKKAMNKAMRYPEP